MDGDEEAGDRSWQESINDEDEPSANRPCNVALVPIGAYVLGGMEYQAVVRVMPVSSVTEQEPKVGQLGTEFLLIMETLARTQ